MKFHILLILNNTLKHKIFFIEPCARLSFTSNLKNPFFHSMPITNHDSKPPKKRYELFKTNIMCPNFKPSSQWAFTTSHLLIPAQFFLDYCTCSLNSWNLILIKFRSLSVYLAINLFFNAVPLKIIFMVLRSRLKRQDLWNRVLSLVKKEQLFFAVTLQI